MLLLSACSTAENPDIDNVAKKFSRKINPNGYVFASTATVTYVVGKDHTVFSEEPGRWVVYQNGSIVAEGAMNATMTIPKFVVYKA